MAQKSRVPLKVIHPVWNLAPLFSGDDDPRIEEKRKVVERKSYEFINKWKKRNDYLEDPAVLRRALDEYEAWNRRYGSDGDEGYYFMLRSQQDMNDPHLKAKVNRADDFSRKIQNDIQFFHLRISKIPKKRQHRFLHYKGLKGYRHFLERLFAESRYLLSEAEERILNLKTSTSYSQWVRMTAGFLAKEEREILTEDGRKEVRNFSEILSLMNSRNRRTRGSAGRAFNGIMASHVEVAEAEMNAILANKKTDDELRGLKRPDLGRHLSDDLESGIVDTLLTTVSDRFSIASRYYALKARLMGVKKLKYHERNVEYGETAGHYSFGKAAALIGKVMRDLDPDFAAILAGFLDKGQIDVSPRKGKASGAFCAHHLLSQPTYILLNHTGTLNDVLTFAHELGHGINNELMRRSQNALNFDSPLSTAEVASTFMEDFVLRELLRKADDRTRLALMMNKLNDDVSTIFRQVACYRFEQDLHKAFRGKGHLAKEEIGALFRTHMERYMGPSVEQSPGSENWWVYWGHIRHFFYVYSYASGLLISKSLQKSVKEDAAFVSKVKEFLSSGLSDSPRNIFGGLGIDIADRSFWNKGLDEVEALIEETAALGAKLGRI